MSKHTLLLINKYYHDTGPAGGVGRYLVQEEEDLARAGWRIVPFAMAEPSARPSVWSDYFVKARDYSQPRFGWGGFKDAISLIWNTEAAAKLEKLLERVQPDVAHVHNIYHHLSPSILNVLRRHRIPIVMTLHDLRLLCPAIHMLRNGEICERCRGGNFHQAVLGRCVKDSRTASLLAAVETFHQRSRRLYENQVDLFLCPSRFIRDKYIAWGFPAHKLRHLPNFVDLEQWHPDRIPRAESRDAYLFFGRLSREKGLRTLLEAQHKWESGHAADEVATPPLQLLIAGEGPCGENLKVFAGALKLKTVELLGSLEPEALRRALGRCRFTVLPSEWYENAPMAALESLASGIPVVGTRLGGIPEMITQGRNGILVEPHDPDSLLAGIIQASAFTPHVGEKARAWAEQNASRKTHMENLQNILTEVMAR